MIADIIFGLALVIFTYYVCAKLWNIGVAASGTFCEEPAIVDIGICLAVAVMYTIHTFF